MREKLKKKKIEIDRQTLHGKLQGKYNEVYKEMESHTQLPKYLRNRKENVDTKIEDKYHV